MLVLVTAQDASFVSPDSGKKHKVFADTITVNVPIEMTRGAKFIACLYPQIIAGGYNTPILPIGIDKYGYLKQLNYCCRPQNSTSLHPIGPCYSSSYV